MSLALAVTRARAGVFYLTITQYDGTAQPLTGATIWFHALVDGVAINKSSPSNGIAITNSDGGLATLTISAADTEAVSDEGIAIGDCELTLVSSGVPYPLGAGKLTVTANVGTP